MTERPRFRTDLVAEPIDDGGLRFIDVLDPDSGNGFRFFEVEYSLACAMDGERDAAGLARWAREELGVEPSLTEIGTVITTLGDLGYLEGGLAATTAAAEEPELARGVVAARPTPVEPVTQDVELGTAGQAVTTRRYDDMPVADALELGTAGGGAVATFGARDDFGGGPELGPAGGTASSRASEFEAPTPPPAEMPSASLRPSSRPDAEEDGPTNLPRPRTMDYEDDEVSVDLADHLAISASDVKEAVRASRVMSAVEVPKELLDQLEDSEARARDEAAAVARDQAATLAAAESAQAAAREAAARAVAANEAAAREAAAREAAAREAAAREVAARPVSELPQVPVGVSKKRVDKEPVADKAPVVDKIPVAKAGGGARRVVWLLLVLAVAVAGAYYVWTKVLNKPLPWDAQGESAQVGARAPRPASGPPAAPPPPPPPAPAAIAVLAEKAGEVSNIVAGQAAVLSFVIADQSPVATGDAVLRFSGNPVDEQKLVGLAYDIDIRYPKQIEAATKARDKAAKLGNAAAVKAQEAKLVEITKKLDQRKVDREALTGKLDGLTIKAPIAGVVKLADKIAKGTRTTADQSVASVTAPATLAATFTVVAGGKVYTADASVRVEVKGTPTQKVNCTTTAVEAKPDGSAAVTVVCPTDAGIPPGTEIILE